MRAKTKTCFSHENSERETSYSAASVGFNDDLLTEILLCLPVISILRFKCVSRHWGSLLSNTGFILRYDARHFRKSPLGLLTSYNNRYLPFDNEDPTTPPFRNFDYFSDQNNIYLLQSCSGLLLCLRRFHYDSKYYVCNPTTRKSVMIPSVPGGKTVRNSIRFMGLTFDQTGSAHYKLVCILQLDEKLFWGEYGKFQIQTYSSDTREWKISVESFSAREPEFGSGVYWNGALHWAHVDHSSYMYFKFDVEQLHLLPLPMETMSYKTLDRYLGESRGLLHLIVYDHYVDNLLPLKVYEMSMDHSGWFVKYHVKLDELRGTFQRRFEIYSVIDVIRGEKDEDTFVVLQINGFYFTYNIHDESFKRIIKLDNKYERTCERTCFDPHVPNSFHRYSQTLASF